MEHDDVTEPDCLRFIGRGLFLIVPGFSYRVLPDLGIL